MMKNTNNRAWKAIWKMGILAFTFACFSLTASAQTSGGIKVEGLVVDAKQVALPSLAVKIKGTGTGVVTNKDGKFEFTQSLKPGDVLVFSYLGLATQEYTIREGMPSVLNITMEEAPIEIIGATADVGPYRAPSALAQWWNRLKDR
ncbi:MAG: carboxypeptidase-like regulatory domain-containing protein [Bacteroidota bacterium]